jgi:hypothetical protein
VSHLIAGVGDVLLRRLGEADLVTATAAVIRLLQLRRGNDDGLNGETLVQIFKTSLRFP